MKRIEDIDREFRQLAGNLKQANTAFQSGDYQTAENLYARSLPALEAAYGEDHQETSQCLQNLADTFLALRKYADAAPLLTRLWIVRQRQFGDGHVDVTAVLFKLAKCYEKMGMPAEAEQTYVQILSGPVCSDRALTASVLESFAGLLRRGQQKIRQAEEMEQRARELRTGSGSLTAERLKTLMNSVAPGSDEAKFLQQAQKNIKATGGTTRFRSLKTTAGQQRSWRDYANVARHELSEQKVPLLTITCICFVLIGISVYWERGIKSAFLEASVALSRGADGGEQEPKKVMLPEYRSVDEYESIVFLDAKRAKLVSLLGPDEGTFEANDNQIVFKGGKRRLVLQRKSSGLVTSDGVTLFDLNSPEWLVIQQMRQIAREASQTFTRGGTHSFHPVYENPFAEKGRSRVSVRTIKVNMKELDLREYNQAERDLNDLEVYKKNETVSPGQIEVIRSNLRGGELLYIRGADRDGKFIRGSNPHTIYVLKVEAGHQIQ